ncbi:multicopper oxidase domain-containing protein [Bdellovibrio sp. 22V]|uniref:multicopper oxidase domain-containing protein n=1 Tax=Bdellovibrio sp. 22V TaxID=3044166 RepID=UPI002542E10D|nr:multicopper oxidase domain-containing protein [Bdellovibrio sp. 22V]WII71779.1 multicopper oxidase domain-containing protein [Bdellovibrio sp. 22V]
MKYVTLLLSILFFASIGEAKTVRYELTVRNEKVNMSGKKEVDFALTVNGGIPAPTLEFTEGDDAEILVKNEIPNEEVSIHWHGILLPPEEDGVAYVNTPPIHPGKSRLFKFKIRQNGTYWYHSHTAVQEQKGVYGAFIIHPKKKAFQYDKDAVVVLSDWSDENADQIIRNLRKDGDYYLYKKDSMRSYFGAVQAGGLKTHLQNEWTRMGGMDLSDVGYDAFLINGKRDAQLVNAHPGEKIRVRIINAAASSYFYVSMGVPMTVIAADGVDIEPIQAKELLMGMAETYDILVTLPEHKNYELRATVQDVTGFGSAWIGMAGAPKVVAPDKPLPDMYASMDHSGHGTGSMSGMDHSDHADHAGHHSMDHSAHTMHEPPKAKKAEKESARKESMPLSIERGAIDWSTQSDAMLRQNAGARDPKAASTTPAVETLTVDALTALQSTTLPKEAKVHELKLVLGGDMERYVWHINGKAINQDSLLRINSGEVVRIVFQNDTMMHHPMHLHGHFFRVVNAQGERSPLKHTVDVPPHGARTIEFYANEPGQWMLHCHNLYHMKTGMARIVRYNDYKLTPEMEANVHKDPHLHEHIYSHTQLEAASNHAKAQVRLMRVWDEINLEVESANMDGKNFSFSEDWETEGDLVYRRWFSNYFNVFGGGTLYHEEGFGMLGVGYILPMLFEVNVAINHEGKLRFDLEKRFQWTKNVFSDAEFTWRPDWGGERDSEFEISLMYGPSWHWSAGFMFTEKSAGIGAQIQF